MNHYASTHRSAETIGRCRDTWRVSAGLLLIVPILAGCGDFQWNTSKSKDHAVALRLTNIGAAPLQCRLHFGHWVERDLGMLEFEDTVEIAIMQSIADGAFYVVSADGQKQMMIENIVCGRAGDWMASFGQVDLAPLRASRPARVTALCALPMDHERVMCTSTGAAP